MRWWPPRPAHNNITTQYKGSRPTSPPYWVRPRLSLATSLSIKCPSHSNLGNPLTNYPSEALTLVNPTNLLVLNATISLNHSINYLCRNASTTPMHNNILIYCLPQTLSRKPCQRANQPPTVHARWLAQPITTHCAHLSAPRKAHCAKHTNQIHFIATIKKPMKKRYISLIKTW